MGALVGLADQTKPICITADRCFDVAWMRGLARLRPGKRTRDIFLVLAIFSGVGPGIYRSSFFFLFFFPISYEWNDVLHI